MKNVVTFGEIMLRLSTPGFERFVQASQFDVSYGGGEANVAVSLAGYGLNSWFVTRLPEHEIGEAALQSVRRYGVNTEHIVRGGDRLGIYFLETGASQRPSRVIYDRADSSVTEIKSGMVDWENIFEGKEWFHWTGITPALGPDPAAVLEEACRAAKKAGVTVSCDLNFRAKLWTEEQARKVMKPLMSYVDVCIANEEDAEKCLGFTAGTTDVEDAHLDEKGYAHLAMELKKEYDFKAVAITLRESFSASRNGWSALLHDDKSCSTPFRSRRYEIDIVDRVGGGDSFAAGLIYGLLCMDHSRDALEFAVAASCLKHSIPGDFNLVSRGEVEKLIKSGGSGRVER
ncbi:MAG: sugar kinase [Balneolaceae bacterium]|nr:MAG: sugar kinase [Balneolaceae bacterium]